MKAAQPEDLHIVPTTAQRYRIGAVDRDTRRAALTTIFDALGIKTLPQRIMVTRKIIFALSSYHFEKGFVFLQKAKDAKQWFDGVAKHSQALSDLITEYPDDFGSFILDARDDNLQQIQNAWDMLDQWARHARIYRGVARKQAGRPSVDAIFLVLIDRLRPLYQSARGKAPARTVDTNTGKPTGRFVQMMRGVCDLGGIDKSDEQIATAIRSWQQW